MISSQNVLRHELIGQDVLVSGAANPLHRGLSGHIIDETKNLLIIETPWGQTHPKDAQQVSAAPSRQ